MLIAAARLVSNTKKFDRGLSRLLHTDLHWLDVPERVQFKLCMTVRRRMQDKAARSATKFGDRAFAISGPQAWNGLPTNVRNSMTLSTFKAALKTHLFI